jgi:transposase-like protein
MKHTTKEPSAQLFCHVLVLVSLLTLTLLGQPVDSQAGWVTCPPHLACFSSPAHRTNKRQSPTLRDREYRMWCSIADSWSRPFLRSLLLAILWSLNGHQTPAWLVGWPWLLWLWQMMTAIWPELGQYRIWRSGGRLLWQGQQLVVCASLSLGLGLWVRHVVASPPLWQAGGMPSSPWPMPGPALSCTASLGCVFCGRQEPWVDVVTEADGGYTATLCGHFTFHIAGDDVFQQRMAIHFLRQVEGPGPQRSGRRTRDGRTPFVSQEKVSAWFHIPQPDISRLEKYWRDKDWANLHSLKATEVLTGDLMARIVAVFVTFPWWGVDKVYRHLRQQEVGVTERQVRQAAEQSGWSQLRQALVRRYHLTADSFRPRDNWLVTDLLAQVQMLLGKVEAGGTMTREEEVSIAELQTLAAEVGIVVPPPLKALPWLMTVERVVFGQWQEVSDEAVHCIYCGSTHVVRKSKKPRRKKYYDAQGQLQTVDVYRYYCRNLACDKGSFTHLPPGLVPYSPYRTHVHVLAIQMYGWGRSTYRCTGQALGVTSMTAYRWVSAWGYALLPVAALFGMVQSSSVVGIDEKYVLVPKNDKPAGKMRRWMYVYLAVDVHTYDLLHIALYPHNDQDSAQAFLLALRAKGYHPHVIVTDLRQDYGPVIARVFPKAQHHECIFHALQNVQDHIKEVYGAGYAATHPQAEVLKQAIYDIFDTQTKRTAQQRYEAVMACRAQYIEDTPAAVAIFDFLERHWPALVNGIESDRIPMTNNTVELVIRRFDQHYQNFCGFDSIDTARLFLAVFEKLYRFTPFSQDAQPRIRGKCPLQLAGYDISQVPMASLCAGLSVDWPLEVAHTHVPNS